MGVPQKPIDAVMRYHNECAMQGRIHEKPKEAFAQLSDKEKRRYEDEYKAELVKYHKAMADHQAKNPLWKTLLELAVPKLSGSGRSADCARSQRATAGAALSDRVPPRL